MASDAVRNDATAWRALNWLRSGDPTSWEPTLAEDPRPAVGFNLSILDALVGTALEPDLTGHVLMLEDVSEPLYRIDRMMFRRIIFIKTINCNRAGENNIIDTFLFHHIYYISSPFYIYIVI
jgi:hypothetical protein